MKKNRIIGWLLCLVMLAVALAGCSAKQDSAPKAVDDGQAKEFARRLRVNHSEFFPTIEGVTELAAPICVVVNKDDATSFLQDEALPIAAQESANALLLIECKSVRGDDGEPSGAYTCKVTYGDKEGDVCVVVGQGLELAADKTLADLLKEHFTFAEGDAALFAKLAAYEAELAGRDYLTAINACRDDYDSVGKFDAADVAEPMVYMVDPDFACGPVGDSDFYSNPAEEGQYVPSGDGPYQRPEIGGSITLGIAGVGKQPDENGSTAYTLEEVEAVIAAPPQTFCFSEVTGKKAYGTYSNQKTGDSFVAYSYNMRVSLISLDGKLLGYRDLSYQPPANDPLGLNAQVISISLSIDKNGDVVFPWGYKDEMWNGL